MSVWIQTFSGEKFSPFFPDHNTVNILDIAHSLSMLCRFNGHIKVFHSVAQHSVQVAQLLYEKHNDTRLAYIGLLHDTTEAYLGDRSRPIKKAMPDFMAIEHKLSYELYDVFGVSREEVYRTHDMVKWADNVALVTEAKQLLCNPPIDDWTSHYPVEPDKREILPLPPEKAKELFLQKYSQYKGY